MDRRQLEVQHCKAKYVYSEGVNFLRKLLEVHQCELISTQIQYQQIEAPIPIR